MEVQRKKNGVFKLVKYSKKKKKDEYEVPELINFYLLSSMT